MVRYAVLIALVCACLMTVPSLPAVGQTAEGVTPVKFNHESGFPETQYLSLKDGARFRIVIESTYPECFEYNFKVKKVAEDSAQADAPVTALEPESMSFPEIMHDGISRDYQVLITKKETLSAACRATKLPAERGENNPFVVQVRTYGWALAFAGGFTIDGLTDPEFALIPAQRTVGEGDAAMVEDGFRIIRQREAEDEIDLGLAAMVHLFNNNPHKKMWRRWAPVSFGLATNRGSEVRYFLGTSLRFSTQLFLTGGVALGSKDRPPNGIDLADHSFTTDANALKDLPTRNDVSWFVGLSYSFLGSKKAFQDAVKTLPDAGKAASAATPAPAKENGSGKDGGKGEGEGEKGEDGKEGEEGKKGEKPAAEGEPSGPGGGETASRQVEVLEMGKLPVGTPLTRTLTFEAKEGEIEISARLDGSGAFSLPQATCTAKPEAPCKLAVVFKPTAPGTEQALLQVKQGDEIRMWLLKGEGD